MCEVSWVFPTPRLVRYLVCFGVLFGLNFLFGGLIYFFIAFKNINNIDKGANCNFIETNG